MLQVWIDKRSRELRSLGNLFEQARRKMLTKSIIKSAALFIVIALIFVGNLPHNANSTVSNDQFLQGSWRFQYVEFPGSENYCQFTTNLIGSAVSGNGLCQFGFVPFPTEDQFFFLDSKGLGAWERIGDSEFQFRMERVVLNEDLLEVFNLRFVDMGTVTVDGDTLTGTFQGALTDLEGNVIQPICCLTVRGSRITAVGPAGS